MIPLTKLRNCWFPSGHEYLLDYFDDYDYRKCREPERLDYRRGDNWVGYQQRAFMVWWAIELCGKTGKVGLDIGSGAVMTPYCLSTDKYMAGEHPVYGGEYANSQLKMSGEDLSIIGDGTIPLIIGSHILEHLEGDIVDIINNQWLPKLEPNGIIAQIVPDNKYSDVMAMDTSHKHAFTATEFRLEVLEKLKDVEIKEFDQLCNNFSFEFIIKRKG